jgi:hypothetical protein
MVDGVIAARKLSVRMRDDTEVSAAELRIAARVADETKKLQVVACEKEAAVPTQDR